MPKGFGMGKGSRKAGKGRHKAGGKKTKAHGEEGLGDAISELLDQFQQILDQFQSLDVDTSALEEAFTSWIEYGVQAYDEAGDMAGNEGQLALVEAVGGSVWTAIGMGTYNGPAYHEAIQDIFGEIQDTGTENKERYDAEFEAAAEEYQEQQLLQIAQMLLGF